MKVQEIERLEEEFIKSRYKDFELDGEDIKSIKKGIEFNRYMLGVYGKELVCIIDNELRITKIAENIIKLLIRKGEK